MPVISPKVSLEEDDDLARVLGLNLPDGDADLGGAGQCDRGVLPPVYICGNSRVNAASFSSDPTLTTVSDGPPLVRWFRDGGQGRPKQLERCINGERADQATVCQFDSDVVVNSVSVFVCGRVIDGSITGTRAVKQAKIPAVSEAEYELSAVEITDKKPVPRSGVDGTVTEGNTRSINVAQAGRMGPNLLDDVDKVGNEGGARANRHLMACARSRRGSRDDVADDVGASISDNFFNNIGRKCQADARVGRGSAGHEGLGRGVELVDERPYDSVAVNLKLHRNLRPGPRLDRELSRQKAANLGGRL